MKEITYTHTQAQDRQVHHQLNKSLLLNLLGAEFPSTFRSTSM
jgi:hypothetical protein